MSTETAHERLAHAIARTTVAVYAQATREADGESTERLGQQGQRFARGMNAG